MKNSLILFFSLTFTSYIPGITKAMHAKNHSYIHHSHKDPGKQIILKAYLPAGISESSGLTYTDGKLWTHNDKGGLPAIYRIDTLTGAIQQTVFIDNFPNIDWEDITADKDHIYIGDFGNNYGIRRDLKVLIIDKSQISDTPVVHINATAIYFSYDDQKKFIKNNKNNFDCESMISIKNDLYLFSKDRGDGRTRVYRLSKTPGTYVIAPYSEFNSYGRVCAAAYNDSAHQLALIGYMPSTINSFLWLMDDFKDEDFFGGTKTRIEIGKNKGNWKTEGITYQSANRLFISCENTANEKAGVYLFINEK